MKTFLAVEIGDSASTEFKMKNGDFEQTQDGIFLGSVEAKDENSAFNKIKRINHNRNRVLDRVVVFEVKNKRYF